MEIALEVTPAIENLFAGWEETIIWSCLQKVMGRVCANDTKSPTAAIALLGDFGFLAGQADTKFLLALKRTVCKRDFLILKDGVPVSGASSYSTYRSGIEVEIDTREDHRREGLATVCGAKLILECLKRNLYPSWDAHNAWSAALAEKLGYRFSHEYAAYETFL